MSTANKVQMSIRFPAEVHAALKDAAWAVHVSQNQFVVDAVSAAIEAVKDAGTAGDKP